MRLWIDDTHPRRPVLFWSQDNLREFFSAMMFAHVEEFEARILNYIFVKDDKERVVFEKIFGDELMSAQELSEGLSLLWDSKDADEGFGDIFD